MSSKPANDKHHLLKVAFSTLAVGLSCWYIGVNILESLVKVKDYPWRENFGFLPLCGATLLLISHYIFDGAVFTYLVRQVSGRVSLLEALRIFFVANLGKYLPGKVWVVVGKTYWLNRRGVEKGTAVSTVSLELALNVAAGAFVSIPILGWLLPFHPLWTRVSLAALLIPLLLGVWSPARRLLVRVAPSFDTPVSARAGRRAFLAYTCSWLLFGLAFWLLVRTVYPVPLDRLPLAIGSIGASWLAGFLVILAPGGLGVRESLLLVLLKSWLPLEIATVVAIASRLWMIAGEFLVLLAVYAFQPRE